jgi:electron-transferring-flavoprotein dehydrogenase
MADIDVLIVGAGPAGLAAAIHLKRRLNAAGRKESVVVFDKAPKPGYHSLSGGVFETDCLDDLVPGWRDEKDTFANQMVKVERDEMYFLTSRMAMQIPSAMVPRRMHHKGDYTVSITKLVGWLGRMAESLGAEVHMGFSAAKLLIDQGKIRGAQLVDLGLDKHGKPKVNYVEGEKVESRVTVVADGSRGVLSRQWTEQFSDGSNPQVYSVGVKQLLQLPKDNAFGQNRVVHTLGFPAPIDVFGGGFFYSMGSDLVAVGLILGLDWHYRDLSPQGELELLKAHPFVSKLLTGAKVVSTGVKTIPEGGYYSLPQLVADGGLLVGDAAGFVNMEKIKGIHYAIRSGMAAADAIFDAIEKNDFSKEKLSSYTDNLSAREVTEDLRHARNFRQSFQWGLFLGAPLSQIQGFMPFKVGIEEDRRAFEEKAKSLGHQYDGGLDKATFTSLSQTQHREDEPSHIKIVNISLCRECAEKYGTPCVNLCPGEVYRMSDGELILSPSNCMHDGSCAVKCPYGNVIWNPPEGGEGPRYKQM